MPHIHTEPGQHDHTASAFIVRLDGPEPRIMLHMHRKLNVLMQFGGHIELHATPWSTIEEEVRQESGYELKQLRILQPKSWLKKLTGATFHPIPVAHMSHQFPGTEHHHTDLEYGFVANQPPAHKVENGESTDIRMYTLQALEALPPIQIPESVREVSRFMLTVALKEWEAVPTSEFEL